MHTVYHFPDIISNDSNIFALSFILAYNIKIYFHTAASLIFYPGGKVQYEAYAPLMEACAQRGILCVLVHMPGNLAVLDVNAAGGIQEEFPEIKNWYRAGHSLGGSMAASYIKSHANEYDRLILLAAYSTEDLSQSGLNILSIYGSEDGIPSITNESQISQTTEAIAEMIVSECN